MRVDLFTLTCSKLENASLVGFRGKEKISEPYEYELFFTVPVGTSARAAVGERATLKGDRGEGHEPLVIHGVVAGVRLLHQTAERALYSASLVPRLWLLRHFWRSYVFTGKNIQAFLTDTLTAGGLASNEFRFSIDPGLYAEEEFVAQYRETHLDFFHRWLEREGLYYYFEHKPDAAGEVLVITDHLSIHEDFPGGGRVRYVPLFGDDATAPEGLHHLEADVRWLPKTVTIADYDYANPAVPLKGESAVTKAGVGAIREYGYRVFGEDAAKRLAEVRAMSIGCRETTMRASGDASGPRAGYRLAVDDRPDELDEAWLAVEVELSGALAGMTPEVARLTGLSTTHTFGVKLFAIPASVQYRAPQTTAWPRIYGFENGIVCGPADSQYAQLDADGRYHVRFEFDTSELSDGKGSTRVRMLQPHGGSTEGFHFPLRKGTEVMIGFLGGDCDRPFIAGVVPNAQKPSVVGSRNQTQNVIRTGGGNQLVLEDEEGKEFIFLHSPNNATGIYMGNPAGAHAGVYTGEGDQTFYMFTSPNAANPAEDINTSDGGDTLALSLSTEGNYGVDVNGNTWSQTFGNQSSFVLGNVTIGNRGTYTFQVGKPATETYYATRTTTTKTGRTDTVEAGGMVQDITPSLTQTIHGSGTQHVTTNWDHTVDGANHDKYGSWHAEAKDSVLIECTGGVTTIKSPTEIVLNAPKVSNQATGQWFKMTAITLDLYGMKNAVGVIKNEACGVSTAVNGMKLEATASASSAIGSKTDLVGTGTSITTTKIDMALSKLANNPITLEVEDVKFSSGSIEARVKALMKL